MRRESAMFITVDRTAHTLAVPQAALERDRDGCSLAFACPSWTQFQHYIALLERLPADFGGGEAGVRPALDKLRNAVRRFGTPAMVRELLRTQPRALCAETAPDLPYAAVLWWSAGLQAASAQVVATLQAVSRLSGDGAHQLEQFELLGRLAQQERCRIAPLLDALAALRDSLPEAHCGLSDACRRTAMLLQRAQEDVGKLHERVGQHERRIAQLGLFGAHRKQELMSQLNVLQNERSGALARVSIFQIQLGALDALLGAGGWLEPALDDAVTSLAKLRDAWIMLGSGVTQLAADASPAQLADATWTERALDRIDAILQWTALERAARAFGADSLAGQTSNFHS